METDQDRCAHRKVRKEMCRLAAALVEAPGTPTEFEGFPGSGSSHRRRTMRYPRRSCSCRMQMPWCTYRRQRIRTQRTSTRMRAWRQGGRAGRSHSRGQAGGRWGAGVGRRIRLWKSRLRRHARPKNSSATSSTLVSPPPGSALGSFPYSPSFAHPARDSGVEFGAFTSGVRQGMTVTGHRADSTLHSTRAWA
ncbi:hypothetical protein DFH08DRAFT_485672 [Mycena albidolilacea]|uniref:Uncharacterized protein n=1 Tax=Mycena albidolilacea TaxID=1033008 RepID=A0AAD7EBC0_9AGAR|nr:hypothetical protein DFH08DRAFT_485672 [Mycena albidolilacea]